MNQCVCLNDIHTRERERDTEIDIYIERMRGGDGERERVAFTYLSSSVPKIFAK